MAILSFPKNPACQSPAAAPYSPAAPHTLAGASPRFRSSRKAESAFFALLQAPLLLLSVPALAQNPGSSAPAAGSPAAPTAPPPAQTAPAAGKLWVRPVAPAAWTVTFKYGSVVAPQQAAHRANMVKVTLLEKEALETIHYPERTAEVWRTGGAVILSEVGSEHAGIKQDQGLGSFGGLGANPDAIKDVSSDKKGNYTATVNGVVITGNVAQEDPDWAEYKEFDWITPEMLKGKIEINGEKLLVYSDMEAETPPPTAAAGKGRAPAAPAPKFPPGPLGGLPLKPGIRVAAIEETTKVPKYLQMGENIQIYAYSKPQQTKLELPPKVASLVEKPAAPPPGAKAIELIP